MGTALRICSRKRLPTTTAAVVAQESFSRTVHLLLHAHLQQPCLKLRPGKVHTTSAQSQESLLTHFSPLQMTLSNISVGFKQAHIVLLHNTSDYYYLLIPACTGASSESEWVATCLASPNLVLAELLLRPPKTEQNLPVKT